MKTLKTVTEIKLLRESLNHQLLYHEDKLKLHSGDIFSTFKVLLTGAIIEKGIYSIFSHFIKRRKKRPAQ